MKEKSGVSRAPIVAGNWKMNGSHESNRKLLDGILDGLAGLASATEVIVCPPAVYLDAVRAQLAGSRSPLGAQDLCEQEQWAPSPANCTGRCCVTAGAAT
jgi:triosephosphate isomerase (EC 5.3.1.1)